MVFGDGDNKEMGFKKVSSENEQVGDEERIECHN